MTKIPEIILVDKPKGPTSFDIIRMLRKKLGVKKLGHAGTLDPLASGLLIIGVDEGTKKLASYIKLPKVYEVQVLLGVKTTTGDMEGDVLDRKKVVYSDNLKKRIYDVSKGMEGDLMLPVPLYSAIKQKGEALYKKARRGENVNLPIRGMKIYSVTVESVEQIEDDVVVSMCMHVGSGAYVRSLAEEVGKRLSLPATVKELRRIKVGDFDISDAKKVDEL